MNKSVASPELSPPRSRAEDVLKREYAERRLRNPQYSLRAFAKQLKISPSCLSEIFSGKRQLSLKMGKRAAERLGFEAEFKDDFMFGIKKDRSNILAKKTIERLSTSIPNYNVLSTDTFDVIADWYHFAILSLMETHDFQNSPKWIAKRLRISPAEVKVALERIQRLGLAKKENGKWVPTFSGLSSTTNIPSSALRKSHRQSILQSLTSLDEISVKDSDITSITMAIDPKMIPAAKELIQSFRRFLAQILETGERTEVYNLNVQLTPVSQLRRTNA